MVGAGTYLPHRVGTSIMKLLGFLIALAAVVAAASAQNQIIASAQSSSDAFAQVASKGARVIHVPAGSTIYHKPPPGHRQQNKQAQAVANARAIASAQAGSVAKHAPAGHPAQHKGGSHPHPNSHHNPKHQNAPPKHAATATATAQATAVAKTPKKSDDKKSPFSLPDLKGVPEGVKKLIEAAIIEGPLIKAGAVLVTGFLEAQKNSVPLIIKGIQKGIKDAADIISPENVDKAIAVLSALPEKIATEFVVKLGEIVVKHADKIGEGIKLLIDAGHLAQAAGIGLSVAATLGLVLKNEVFSKIPLDLSKLPLDKLPITLDKLPIPLDKLPFDLDHLPIPLDKLPIALQKFLTPFEKQPEKKTIAVASVGSQAVATGGQAVADTAKVGAEAQVVVASPVAAVAEAEASAAAEGEESPEDFDDGYDDDEASVEAEAAA